MQFQAKSDLPKHWNTSKHLGDPRIPLPNTPEYTEVLTRSEILHNLKKMKKEAEDSISTGLFLSPPSSSSSTSSRSSAIESANSPDNLASPPIISDNDATIVASAVTVNVFPPLVPSMFTIDSPEKLQQSTENEDEIPDLDL